jgi:hypothetical protein
MPRNNLKYCMNFPHSSTTQKYSPSRKFFREQEDKEVLFEDWVPVGRGRYEERGTEGEYGGDILHMCM